MAAEIGNKLWKRRKKHGRNYKFDDAEKLWEMCVEYFEWVENNPLQEEKVFQFQGEVIRTTVNKMRAMTKNGLCCYIGITDSTWDSYKQRGDDFLAVLLTAEAIIREQKFTGAAADIFNANLIARDLGLANMQRTELTGKDGGPVETRSLNDFYADIDSEEPPQS